ncbi:MAG TPA: hypothetical protein PKV43_04690 [Armatimonadota bacterium]|nr:hypothetical protein [Armatimonadota bacterium]
MNQTKSVPRLRQETVQKILKAADSAKMRVEDGTPVDDALAEVAREYELGPEQAKLLVQGWNIDASLEHLKSASSLEDRLQSIPIAHYDNVIAILNKKQAAVTDRPSSDKNDEVWSGYYRPPAEEYVRPMVKDAFAEQYPADASSDMDKLGRAASIKAARNAILRKDLLKWAHEEVAVMEHRLRNKIDEIDWAMAASRADLKTVKDNLKVASREAYEFLVQVEPRLQRKYEINQAYIAYDPNKYPYRTILEAVKIAKDLYRAKNLTEKLAKISENFVDPAIDYGVEAKQDPTNAGPLGFYIPYEPRKSVKPLVSTDEVEKIASDQPVDCNEIEKEAGIGDAATQKVKDILAGGFHDVIDSVGLTRAPEDIQQELKEYSRKKHEDVRTSILYDPTSSYNKRQIMDLTTITSLLSQDPEILNYDPAEVYKVYKDLVNLAPLAMLNPIVAKTMVRQALAQNGLGTYDLKLLASIDALMREDNKSTKAKVIED